MKMVTKTYNEFRREAMEADDEKVLFMAAGTRDAYRLVADTLPDELVAQGLRAAQAYEDEARSRGLM